MVAVVLREAFIQKSPFPPLLRASRIARGISDWRCCLKRRAVHTVNSACLRRRAHILNSACLNNSRSTRTLQKKTTRGRGVASAARRAVPPAVRRGRCTTTRTAAARPPEHSWVGALSLSAQRAGARTAALTSGSGSRPTAAPTHTEQHAQDSHRTLPLTPLTAMAYSDLDTGTSLSTPCTRLPVAVTSAASCPDQTPATWRRR